MPAAPRLPEGELPRLRRALLAWHRRHGLHAPWRTSGDPYRVLVAAVMAQQTQMSRVLPKYGEFVRAFPTVESLARASTARVLRVWEGMGYNLRALRLQRAARRVVRDGGFPRAAGELEEIEGIGPFTAAIVASFAFGEPVAAVDTNVERVVRRLLGDLDGALSTRERDAAAQALLARRSSGRWNQAMMDLGGTVCTARAPTCDACPLARWCRGRDRLNRVERTTRPGRRRQEPFHGSARYYRGRIVQALRELPAGRSITMAALRRRVPSRDGLDATTLRRLIAGLERDGLVRVEGRRRLRLP